MAAVHVSPDEKSPVIAYMGSGTTANVIKEEGNWGKIKLMDGGAGYISLKYLGSKQ